jgi:predicted nucleic acid-binding protein
MKPVLFDTSVYIASLRRVDDRVTQTRNLEHGSPLWLSAVVLEELYAGADTFDKVNPRELAENAAVMAVLAYALADLPEALPKRLVNH